MALNKSDFITILNYYKRENDKVGTVQVLKDLGIAPDLAKFFISNYWGRQSFGGAVFISLAHSKLLPDLSLKKLQITYKVVKEDKTYEFEPPEINLKGVDTFVDNSNKNS